MPADSIYCPKPSNYYPSHEAVGYQLYGSVFFWQYDSLSATDHDPLFWILKTAQQHHIAKQLQKTDTNQFFNLLTSLDLLDLVEAQKPEHRESKFPPTQVLSMFLGQAMNPDHCLPEGDE